MGQLGQRDLHAALRFTHEAQEAESLEQLRRGLLPALQQLVPCDSLGYNEIDLRRGTGLGIVYPADSHFDGFESAFMSVIHQHPLVKRQGAGDQSTRAISDFLTTRQFHRLELYHDFYRRIEAEDQLAFGVPGEVMIAFALCRSSRDFSERDRELLELVRPGLAIAYRHARELERDRAFISALDESLEQHHAAIIQLDSQGRTARRTDAADELLEAYLQGRRGEAAALPARLRDQLRAENGNGSPRELVLENGRGRLRVREQRYASEDGGCTLLLEEERCTAPRLELLCELGLTHRQAQVLRLLALGKSSRQIGAELQISTATTEKHLEHIYSRLGVNNRAEAVSRVYAS